MSLDINQFFLSQSGGKDPFIHWHEASLERPSVVLIDCDIAQNASRVPFVIRIAWDRKIRVLFPRCLSALWKGLNRLPINSLLKCFFVGKTVRGVGECVCLSVHVCVCPCGQYCTGLNT